MVAPIERVTVRTTVSWWTITNDAGRAWLIGRIAEHLQAGCTVKALCGFRWCEAKARTVAGIISDELSNRGHIHAWHTELDGSWWLVFEVA